MRVQVCRQLIPKRLLELQNSNHRAEGAFPEQG